MVDPHIDADLTIGVIGGMGPYATLALFKALLDNTPASKDWDHPRILIDNNPKIPSRTRAFLYGEADPVPHIVRAAEGLRAAGADFMIMPCNSAHYFLPQVMAQTDVPFVDMIQETSRLVLATECSCVGMLGGEVTVHGRVYEQWLESSGVNVLHVTDDEQKAVRAVIEEVKLNAVSDLTYSRMQNLVNKLEACGAEAVILGCTELPLAMQGVTAHVKIINSLDALAKAAVYRAKRVGVES
jgi:aspartate racemase